MSLLHCSPHQSRAKGNFCKVYSVNCFGQTGKRLKPTNDYNWQHRRDRFLKNPKLNTIILLPDALSSRVCSIIYLFSVKLWNRKNNNFRVFVNRRWNWEFIVDAKVTDLFRDRNLSANTLAVCCSYILNLIGCRTINILVIILGVHGLLGFTVKRY